MNIKSLVKGNYDTYKNVVTGDSERHKWRIFISLFISAIVITFTNDPVATYPIMVTVLTILTGFTFTALFSNQSNAGLDLPEARNETDRSDLRKLVILSDNFKARTAYFIPLAIAGACFLMLASMRLSWPQSVIAIFKSIAALSGAKVDFIYNILSFLKCFSIEKILFFLGAFILMESLYTFYRLSDTILAIIRIRGDYLSGRINNE